MIAGSREIGMPLLTTKLYIPSQRPNLVLRPRLMARLEDALRLGQRLALISAKAGSGKTTLVSEWLHRQERPATWLSLDANDNDPRRFLQYLVAALQQLDGQIGQAALGQLDMSPLPQPESVVETLINDLANRAPPFTLVLDDYHLIRNEWIHQAVGFLAEYQPPQMHLILVTRVDPPLPLARLRGRGQMAEIRDLDLRFTVDEAAWFVNHIMKLGLPADAVSTLERRTEGWIVGLQMAAISMQGRKRDGNLIAFVEAFDGTNRYILDYLMEEVLEQQTPPVQDFLVETSILDRMCGDLCDVVRSGQAGGGDSQTILAQLERSNLFVTSLDDERRWYRYHHLFADLLKSTLAQRHSAEQIRELHRRASRWHQSEGSLEEAMTHAMAGKDYERAASMIDENIVSMLSQSEGLTLLGWIEKLPQEIVRGRPWVDVHRAYTLALSGRAAETDSLLEGVAARIEPDTPRASELRGHIAAIRSYTANLWGDANRAIEMAALAERNLPEEHLVARGMASYALAVTHLAKDDIDSSMQASLNMLEIGKKLDRLLMILTALCDLATATKILGRFHRADEYYHRARQWMAKRKGLDSRVRSAYEAGVADLMYRWNQLDAAHEHATMGIEYCRRFGVPSELVSCYVTLMRVSQARGEAREALDALHHAEQIAETHYLRLATQIELRTSRVIEWLAAGEVETARRWADKCDGGTELEQIALARLWLALGRAADAQRLLEQQHALAEAGKRRARVIEILGLQALALEAQGRSTGAYTALARALALARPEGYDRVFLDMGLPLGELLARTTVQGTPAMGPVARDYAGKLLEALRTEGTAQGSQATAAMSVLSTPGKALPDPPTERELEVLRLLAKGLTNKEIARRLVVAPSTIKQHLKNIYSKLDVHSRTQAVARGRELGLL
jgi:LuxR family maltose regulon positive regulatory protein